MIIFYSSRQAYSALKWQEHKIELKDELDFCDKIDVIFLVGCV